MKKSLQNKIKKYSLATGAMVVAGASANAQVVYTDVDPDFVQNDVGHYELDVDDNGVMDFIIQRGSGSMGGFLRFLPKTATSATAPVNGNEVLGATSNGGAYFLPFALDIDSDIDDAQTLWNGTINGGAFTMAWGSAYGYWAGGQTDKYIGFRFDIDGNTHYGWARLDAVASGEGFTLKDYAYESTAETGITAGDMGGPVIPQADPATNLVATDLGDNHDGSDFGLTFDAAADEATVSEYWVMIVKEANAATFDTTAAHAVAAGNYTVIAPTGSAQDIVLDAAATDVDGDAIAEDVAYKAFVLSVADGTNAELNEISEPSNAITLVNTDGIEDTKLENINIFANNESLNIEMGIDVIEAIISVYNTTGQEVLNETVTTNKAKLDITNLSSGVYVVRVYTGDDAISKTIKL